MGGKEVDVDSAVAGGGPIPPKRLFTWIDVDEHLMVLASHSLLPDWLDRADSWWDGLELSVGTDIEQTTVERWLNETFGQGSTAVRNDTLYLKLDDPRTNDFIGLPVRLEHSDSEAGYAPRRPVLRDRHITRMSGKPLDRPKCEFADGVQLVAFHSFKGGVGRTVHAVAMADAIAAQGGRVLLVDADLEAPGITWMYKSQSGSMDFCYEDLLALLHASEDGTWDSVVEFGEAYLPNQQVGRYGEHGSVSILPASRRTLLGPPRIDPAILLTPDRPQYFLTEAIAGLAARIGAEVAIVDLRAGASELSAPILLDPRVQRVFVTSLSHQSLSGTKDLVRQLMRRAPSLQGRDPASAVVVTQYRPDIHGAQLGSECAELSDILAESLQGPEGSDTDGEADALDRGVLTQPLCSPFREELLALSSTWDAVVRALNMCRVSDVLKPLLLVPPPRVVVDDPSALVEPRELRRRLAKTAFDLVYAEQGAMASADGFLVTDAMSRLIGDHRTEPPVALVIGAKGSGKTFMFAKACAARTWQQFADDSGIEGSRLDAPIVPVLESPNLDSTTNSAQVLRDSFARRLGGAEADTYQTIVDLLRRGLQTLGTDEIAWRRLWLRCLCAAAGRNDTDREPEDILADIAKLSSAVFVIDGLEDLLQTMTPVENQVALRVLLVDVVNWLRAMRGRPLGLLVFVRQDLVGRAVPQNSGQLMARFGPYALNWGQEDALRLALWVARSADALPRGAVPDVDDLSYEDVTQALIPLWGWKLGTEKSKEARSHLWVPAALGDFNNQVQARDVVLFLADAATKSLPDHGWDDRLLVPSAMRRALLSCSRQKIDAIQQENQEVGGLLVKIENNSGGVTVPFQLKDIGLKPDEAAFLIESGVFARDPDGRYWVAEIYRHGLGLGSARRARVLWR
ncbi:KGGVGR-motif variant AAA ATPase [Nocardia fluminea]|uniref:KGGVGR-motif variant AAA ATPase n=1 Tax=Nocardia fluminea TaxID=134984 RepID=UPI0033DF5E19